MLTINYPEKIRRIVEEDIQNWPTNRIDTAVSYFSKTQPEKVAVIDPWRRITYAELEEEINRLAIKFKSIGIKKNSVVMYQLPNIIESVIIFHAALRAGAIALPVTPIYREAEIESLLNEVKPDIVFIPSSYKKKNFKAMYDGIQYFLKIPVITIDIPDEPVQIMNNSNNWNDFLQDVEIIELPELEYDPYEYCLLMFTSGTTSNPKGVLHSHATLGVAISTFDGINHLHEESRFFVPSPVTHITGVVVGILGPIQLGATSVLMPTWDPVKAFDYIQREKCNYIMAATPFLSQLLTESERRKESLTSLQYFACGGADISEALLRKIRDAMPNCIFSRVYGSTEAPGISKFKEGFDSEKRLTRDGRISDPIKARIKADDLYPDGSGELEVYGPQLFMRYIDWHETEKALNGEWFSTGDLAILDDESFVKIKGREKDIIIRGGENYSAREIEDILIMHPSIEVISIVGFSDPVMGERACAFVVLRENAKSVELSDLTELLERKKIARQKWPERLMICDSLPYTHSGKLQKYLLKDMISKREERLL